MGQAILKVWLDTEFAGGRHARRVDKISEMDARRSAREAGL
jgi:ribose 5-phosphate isomerase RpiB